MARALNTTSSREVLGFVGKGLPYENSSMQTITDFWFGLHKLHRRQLLSVHADTDAHATNKGGDDIIPAHTLVRAMSCVSDNVPIFYHLLLIHPTVCRSDK